MHGDRSIDIPQEDELDKWLSSDVYRQNLAFWEKAWNMVKSAYTQMPDIDYLSAIPQGLARAGARRVLDLGCGSGWLSVYLARNGFHTTGIDIAAHAIELARDWARKEQLDCRFDVGDIAALPYPAGSFDAIVANSIFEHLTYAMADSTLARLKKILLPGGVFLGCFDRVGGGPGKFYELEDRTHVYTDKGRMGMILRYFSDEELDRLFSGWIVSSRETTAAGTRIIWART